MKKKIEFLRVWVNLKVYFNVSLFISHFIYIEVVAAARFYVVLWGKAKDQSKLDTSTENNGLENESNNNNIITTTEESNIDINQSLLQHEGSVEHLNHSHTQITHE